MDTDSDRIRLSAIGIVALSLFVALLVSLLVFLWTLATVMATKTVMATRWETESQKLLNLSN